MDATQKPIETNSVNLDISCQHAGMPASVDAAKGTPMDSRRRLPIISRGANDARRILHEVAVGPYGYIHPGRRRPGLWILDMRDMRDKTILYLATTTRAAAEEIAMHHGAQFLVEEL